jgi:hypothetical protein
MLVVKFEVLGYLGFAGIKRGVILKYYSKKQVLKI